MRSGRPVVAFFHCVFNSPYRSIVFTPIARYNLDSGYVEILTRSPVYTHYVSR